MYSGWRNEWQQGAPWDAKRPKTGPEPPGMAGQDFNPFQVSNTHDAPHSSSTIQFLTNNTTTVNVEVARFSKGWEKSYFKSFVWAFKKSYSAMDAAQRWKEGRYDDNKPPNSLKGPNGAVPNIPVGEGQSVQNLGIVDYKTRATRRGVYGNNQPTLLMHLPLLNYHLLRATLDSHGEALRSVDEVYNMVQPAGVVNSHETLVDIHSYRSADTRVLICQGPVDVHNIWSGIEHPRGGGANNSRVKQRKLQLNDSLFFVIRPIFPGFNDHEVKDVFMFTEDDGQSVSKREIRELDYYFQVIPYYTTGEAPPKHMYTVRGVEGGYWRVGKTQYGVSWMYNSFIHSGGDPTCNFNNIVKAPILSMMVDIAQTL